jgi:small subunit ribosomal protein S8
MSSNDPIADFLTRIRNAHLAKHDRLDVPSSRIKVELAKILKDQGFIRNFRVVEDSPSNKLRVYLRYDDLGTPAIAHVERLSKPGRRVFRKSKELAPVRNGLGVGILSTSQGLMTDAQAREQGLGGELLCQLW